MPYQDSHFLVCVPQSDDPDISRSMEDTICLVPVQNQTSSCKIQWKQEEADYTFTHLCSENQDNLNTMHLSNDDS